MKRLLFAIGMLMYMATEGNGGTPPETNEQKLARLQDEYKKLWAEMVACEPGSDDAKKAAVATYRKQSEIDAVNAQIAKLAAEAKLTEARNAKLALVDNLVALAKIGKPTPEQTVELTGLIETIKNEIIAKLPAAKTAAVVGESAGGGTKGAKTAEIRALFDANRATGMSDTDNTKAIIAAGYSRGTTGAVILAYQREMGEKE